MGVIKTGGCHLMHFIQL